jgi:exodeoxyribonuclease VII small subunit
MSKKKFEDHLQDLEQIALQMESGQLSLEDALEKYTQGVRLVQQCQKILTTAEQKVTRLATDDLSNEDAIS